MDTRFRFRGKRKDNGEWAYGDLLHIGGGAIIYTGSTQECETTNDARTGIELSLEEVAVVDPETVGQVTGFCDRRDNELYEDDIIRAYGRNMRVAWHAEDGQWVAASKDELCPLVAIAEFRDIECVVGNIHDNPNLLKDDFLKKYSKQRAWRSLLRKHGNGIYSTEGNKPET